MKHSYKADDKFTDKPKCVYSLSSYEGHQKGGINMTFLSSVLPTLSMEAGSLMPWQGCFPDVTERPVPSVCVGV